MPQYIHCVMLGLIEKKLAFPDLFGGGRISNLVMKFCNVQGNRNTTLFIPDSLRSHIICFRRYTAYLHGFLLYLLNLILPCRQNLIEIVIMAKSAHLKEILLSSRIGQTCAREQVERAMKQGNAFNSRIEKYGFVARYQIDVRHNAVLRKGEGPRPLHCSGRDVFLPGRRQKNIAWPSFFVQSVIAARFIQCDTKQGLFIIFGSLCLE